MATSLLNLEEDLTCSICLCPFDGPVSLACGHSFCQGCLEAAWTDAVPVSCPHCRALYTARPELKRNTVLAAVVDTLRSASDATTPPVQSAPEAASPKPKPKPKPVLCDTCMVTKAESTCMTCAASFCGEHVRPHRDNPVYRAHRLVEPPLADLQHRLCADHAKLLEFFCGPHGRALCSGCLQAQHRGCAFFTVEEQRDKKESEMKDKLCTLDGKIEKNQLVISQMREQQVKLKDVAAVRRRALEAEYQQLRDLLQRDESEAIKALEKDLEGGQTKLSSLMKKFSQNIEKMSRTKDEINQLLTQSDSMDFLQTSVDMPSVTSFDPYAPRINLDSKAVIAYHASIVNLKEHLSKILSQPVENRLSFLKSGASVMSQMLPNPRETVFGSSEDLRPKSPPPAKGAPGAARKKPLPRELNRGERKDNRGDKKDNRGERKDHRGEKKDNRDNKESRENKEERANRYSNKGMPPFYGPNSANFEKRFPDLGDMPSVVKRSDLLKFATILMFDQRTAHRRVAISENNTKASVSDEPSAYPDIPPRFTVCSQVLCSKGFSQGRHYWEVKMSSNNFCGIGLAYGSIDRKGPCSRLGRNGHSWCIEWFNLKLSAWHNGSEMVLSNPHPSRVGVLLDCDEGSATFYNVTDRAQPFHMFALPFSEPVFPAFWMFSSGSSITLCKLTN